MISQKQLINFYVLYWLRRLQNNFPFEKEQIKKIQIDKTKNILNYAYNRFKAYRKLMDDAGFHPSTFESIDDLKRIPETDKSWYRKFTNDIVHKRKKYFNSNYHIDGTSGSSGYHLTIYRTWFERAYIKAKFLRALFINRYNIFDRTYWLVSPRRVDTKDSIIQKFGIFKRYNESFLYSEQEWYNGYQKAKPDILISNKTQLVGLAKFVINNNKHIEKPKLCVCMSEVLDGNSRFIIEKAFGSGALIDIYGATEFSTLAFKMRNKDNFNICHDTNIIELDTEKNYDLNDGSALITDLHIHSFPLIRYRLGDRLKIGYHDGIKVIRNIRGRENDVIKLKDGGQVSFYIFYEIMERFPQVLQFRFIQEKIYEIRVLLVLEGRSDRLKIARKLQEYFSNEISTSMIFKLEFVEDIPRDKTGKLRMIVNHII